MPLRKLYEEDFPNKHRWCTDPSHNAPSHISLEDGLYEYECPSCGKLTRFRVANPRCEVTPK